MKNNGIIKELMIEKNLSQAEMAEMLNIPYSTFNKYLQPGIDRAMPASLFSKIADLFGVSTDYLAGRVKFKEDEVAKKKFAKEIFVLQKGYENMDRETQDWIYEMTKMVIEKIEKKGDLK